MAIEGAIRLVHGFNEEGGIEARSRIRLSFAFCKSCERMRALEKILRNCIEDIPRDGMRHPQSLGDVGCLKGHLSFAFCKTVSAKSKYNVRLRSPGGSFLRKRTFYFVMSIRD